MNHQIFDILAKVNPKNFISIFLLVKIIATVDFFKIFFVFTWFKFIFHHFRIIEVDYFYHSSKLKQKSFNFSDIFKPKSFIKNTLLQRDLEIYEIDTALLIKNLNLNCFESIIEIGACYGYFTSMFLKEINDHNSEYSNTKLVSIEPFKDRVEKFLYPLQEIYPKNLLVLNDYAGPNSSIKNRDFLKTFFEKLKPNSSFLFLDADYEGISPVDLAISILSTFELIKIKICLIEMSNTSPRKDAQRIRQNLLSEFKIMRLSKKRFLFYRNKC